MSKINTDITLVVDRSGSMASIKDDMEGGINSFIEEQGKLEGKASLTLIEFDDHYDVVYVGDDIKNAPKYELHPRGRTALLDAVGKAISVAEERIRNMLEADRPDQVLFVIVTDGFENASSEYKLNDIKKLVKETHSDWEFTFIGADFENFGEGVMHNSSISMGFNSGSSCIVRGHAGEHAGSGMACLNSVVTSYRAAGVQNTANGLFDEYNKHNKV